MMMPCHGRCWRVRIATSLTCLTLNFSTTLCLLNGLQLGLVNFSYMWPLGPLSHTTWLYYYLFSSGHAILWVPARPSRPTCGSSPSWFRSGWLQQKIFGGHLRGAGPTQSVFFQGLSTTGWDEWRVGRATDTCAKFSHNIFLNVPHKSLQQIKALWLFSYNARTSFPSCNFAALVSGTWSGSRSCHHRWSAMNLGRC